MKESERIKQEMINDKSDNDQRDVGYLRKLERALKMENFEDFILPKIAKKYRVEIGANESYLIITDEIGVLTYYPKADSLLFNKENYYEKNGLKWLKSNLI